MKIKILIDNHVFRAGLKAEHGFSLWIEKDKKQILFDCGQSSLLIENSHFLGVDLSGLDAIVLSHGHFDHTGGLLGLLKKIKKNIRVYAHPSVFEEKFAIDHKGKKISIGIPCKRETYEEAGADFILSSESQDIFDGIWTSGQVPRKTDFETVEDHFARKEKDATVKDEILDDLSLIIEDVRGLVIVTGCAHAGVLNILQRVHEFKKNAGRIFLIGGLHMNGKEENYIRKSIGFFQEYGISRIVTSHCSGLGLYCALRALYGSDCSLGNVGKTICFD